MQAEATKIQGHVEGLYIDENFELRAGAVTFGTVSYTHLTLPTKA